MQDKQIKEIKITKTIENNMNSYNMTVSANIDRDELVGLLQSMLQRVTMEQQTQLMASTMKLPSTEYIG